MKIKKCQDPDLNWGHEDLQSTALPTELPRQSIAKIQTEMIIVI
jgi:hypothetical protein